MMVIDDVIKEVEARVDEESKELERLGAAPLRSAEISVMGQMALLMDEEASRHLFLARTADVDALIKGDTLVKALFVSALKSRGLVLDHLSSEIWVPPGATFKPYYASERLTVSYLDPISTLTSKAVMAKEKNKLLIAEALTLYGESLARSIQNNGGDIEFFKNKQKLKL